MPIATKKNLFLDRESMHVDDYDEPVTDQISNWMKDMKLIREYVRELLQESKRVGNLLSSGDYGILFRNGDPVPPMNGEDAVIMIFNINKFFDYFDPDIDISEGDEIWDAVEEALYDAAAAMIAYRRAGHEVSGKRHKGLKTGPCYGGFEIKRIASKERGFSWPLRSIVLDLANQEGTGFFSDRESVSLDAKLGYKNKMSGYQRLKFDNELDPQTPDPNDDCLLYSDVDPSAESLDYLYFQDSGAPPYLDILLEGTEIFIGRVLAETSNRVKKANGMNANTLRKWLQGYGGTGVAYDLFGDVFNPEDEE